MVKQLARYSGLACFKQMVETERQLVEAEDGVLDQIIPLYLKQDEEGVGGVCVPTNAGAVEDVGNDNDNDKTAGHISAGHLSGLMAYPPLAYLMNALLTGLNFLRDCPLLVLKDSTLSLLRTICHELCNFIVLHSDHIREKGKRFVLDTKSLNSTLTVSGKSASTVVYEENMDKVFASKVVDNIIPHCLDCLKTVFGNGTAQGSTDDAQFLRNVLEVESSCRSLLLSANLVELTVPSSVPVPAPPISTSTSVPVTTTVPTTTEPPVITPPVVSNLSTATKV